jgi:molybdenum cofactor cytidylyltransferase
VKFGPLPIEAAAGAVLAHAVVAGALRLRKGHTLSADDIGALRAAGVAEVIVATLEPGDLGENDAATRLAEAARSSGVTMKPAATGRVNLHARTAGVFTVDRKLVDAINAVDPDVTLATLAEHASVEAGQMVATVKIIPFAVGGAVVDQVTKLLHQRELFAVHPFRALKVALVQTELPSVKSSVLDKTVRITAERLDRSGSCIVEERRVPHEAGAVASAVEALAPKSDLLILFGASAVSDPDDVLPAAIKAAGGNVARVGMPVDPGNLLVLGDIGGKPVLGAPGCARSPKENGFDWVLDRLVAGLKVTDADIAGMGVGGLLMEIPTRPQPREASPGVRRGKVHAVVLAAGRSTRMGGPNKLLALFDGKPLVRQTVERALASKVSGVTVVTGHQAERVVAALTGLDVGFAENPDYRSGLAGSLQAGLAGVPKGAYGVLVLLGDMPGVTSADMDRLIAAFAASGASPVVRSSHQGKRGNPVILPRALFAAVARLEGDTGARHLVEAEGQVVVDVEIGEGAFVDVDTPDALRQAGGMLQD